MLLENCNNIGIRPAVLSWLASYLSGRSQVTRYGNEISDRAVVGGGVPLGSRIGPVAFIVHINGLPMAIQETDTSSESNRSNEDREETEKDDIALFMDKQQKWS